MKQAQSATAIFRQKLDCIVPKVVGKSLKIARRKIRQAHCRTGKITHGHSRARKGRVISQRPRARKHLRDGSKVNVVLSDGRRR
jgi:beta-lactam-binding protein with PASTA domain